MKGLKLFLRGERPAIVLREPVSGPSPYSGVATRVRSENRTQIKTYGADRPEEVHGA